MRKIAVVTVTEIQSFVQTKAFLLSLVLMPLLMFGGGTLQAFLMSLDAHPRAFAVLDHSGTLYGSIARAAAERDGEIAADSGLRRRGRFVPSEQNAADADLDEARLKLSDDVRKKRLFAFVEIPADATSALAQPVHVSYYSDSPTDVALRDWLRQVLAQEIRARRYHDAGVAPEVVVTIERPVQMAGLDLFERGPDGVIRAGAPFDPVRTVVMPLAVVLVLWFLVFVGAPHLLNAVLEEKMSRISEVLLGSATPFELMMGKLLGAAAVSLLLAALYVAGGLGLASHFGFGGLVSAATLAYFTLFLVLATLFYGSLSLAVGSACNTLKEAQSMYMPVVLLCMAPVFVLTPILQSPSSSLAVGASLFPPTAPFVMMLRLCLHPSPPGWQVALSIVLLLVSTWASVWGASRVLRVALLMQGKAPSLFQLARWAMADG